MRTRREIMGYGVGGGLAALFATPVWAQMAPPQGATGSHRDPPPYPFTYQGLTGASVKAVLDRVLAHLEGTSPMAMIDRRTEKPVAMSALDENSSFAPAQYRLISYEWGVTYSGMLLAGEVTGDKRYTRYAADRINYVSDVAKRYRGKTGQTPVRSLVAPRSLDDSGAMAASFIKAQRASLADANVRPQIDVWTDFIHTKQFRLNDGTLARNRPVPDTLWLDDLYMSVPALAQMGALTKERRWFDDAVKQILQFSSRMFVPEEGLYRHGWIQSMETHPAFFWGRANGWAVMAMVELLEVLPADHPGREAVLTQLRAHIAGLVRTQSHVGLWHQLLDRNDTYLETSATAIFAFSIARAINRGWIDAKAHAPTVSLAWNALVNKVNAAGEVEDVVIGTGMGFDPAFYAYRPVHVRAAHGYGPLLLAGAETIAMLKKYPPRPDENIADGVLF